MSNERSSFLNFALSSGALEFIPDQGRELKSGRFSPYFFNSGLFTSGLAIQKLTEVYHACFNENLLDISLEPDVIFGPAYKGITLAHSLTAAIGSEHISYAFNRKEAKDHGEGGSIVGASLEGKWVLIIDDVITSGKAIREAIDIIKEQGGIPVGCLICFDREEKGKDTNLSAIQQVEKGGIPVYSAVTFSDLFPLIQQEGSEYQDMLPAMEAYRDKYGIEV